MAAILAVLRAFWWAFVGGLAIIVLLQFVWPGWILGHPVWGGNQPPTTAQTSVQPGGVITVTQVITKVVTVEPVSAPTPDIAAIVAAVVRALPTQVPQPVPATATPTAVPPTMTSTSTAVTTTAMVKTPPTQTPPPTQPPASTQAVVPGSGPKTTSGLCVDDAWAESQLGLHVQGISSVPWRNCQWVWNAFGASAVTKVCPKDWLCTLALTDDTIKVFVGDGTTQYTFKAGTFNYVPKSVGPVNQNPPCAFLQEENAFGQSRSPSYETTAGNFFCNGTSPAPAATPVPPQAKTGQCPGSQQDVANLVGGNPDKWSKPDLTQPQSWIYKNKGNLVQFNHPGFGRIDYWDGAPASQTNAGPLPSLQDEITFKCN